jgi:hypothetical protein
MTRGICECLTFLICYVLYDADKEILRQYWDARSLEIFYASNIMFDSAICKLAASHATVCDVVRRLDEITGRSWDVHHVRRVMESWSAMVTMMKSSNHETGAILLGIQHHIELRYIRVRATC